MPLSHNIRTRSPHASRSDGRAPMTKTDRRAAPKVRPDRKAKAAPPRRREAEKAFKRKFARTIEENLSHLRFNLEACVPGLLDTHPPFRQSIIRYLRDQYSAELRRAGGAHA